MNWKTKFIIAWMNKKADINSKYQQLLEQINQLPFEDEKLKLTELLNTVLDITNLLKTHNLSNQQYEEIFDFLFSRAKKEFEKYNKIDEQEIANAADNLVSYFFIKNKKPLNYPKLRDILTFNQLENVIMDFNYILEENKTRLPQEIENVAQNYLIKTFQDLDNNNYKIFKIPRSTDPKKVEDLRILAHGKRGYQNNTFDSKNAEGRWCILQEHMAKNILSEGDFYIVYKNDEVFASLGYQRFNCVNRINKKLNYTEWSILIKPFFDLDCQIIKYKLPKEYNELIEFYIETRGKTPELLVKEKINEIKNKELPELIEFCKKYGTRIKEREKDIIKHPKISIDYSYAVFGNKWPSNKIGKLAELNIAQNSTAALDYALLYFSDKEITDENDENDENDIFSFRKFGWPQNKIIVINNKEYNIGQIAEMSIAQDVDNAITYAAECLKHRWPQNCEAGQIAEKNISENIDKALKYLSEVIKDQWPKDSPYKEKIERKIAENAEYAVLYAKEYIKNRWPNTEIGKIAEKNIANDVHYANIYAQELFVDENGDKGDRWPEENNLREIAEKNISTNSFVAYEYAENCMKKPWDINTENGKIAVYNIINNYNTASNYAVWILKDRYPDINIEINNNIYNIRKIAEQNIIIKDIHAFNYACIAFVDENGQKGARWPEENNLRKIAESNIVQNPRISCLYAKHCIKNRWPQNEKIGKIAEEIIMQDQQICPIYEKMFNIKI